MLRPIPSPPYIASRWTLLWIILYSLSPCYFKRKFDHIYVYVRTLYCLVSAIFKIHAECSLRYGPPSHQLSAELSVSAQPQLAPGGPTREHITWCAAWKQSLLMALASPLCSSRQKLLQMGTGAQGSRLCPPAGMAAPPSSAGGGRMWELGPLGQLERVEGQLLE